MSTRREFLLAVLALPFVKASAVRAPVVNLNVKFKHIDTAECERVFREEILPRLKRGMT